MSLGYADKLEKDPKLWGQVGMPEHFDAPDALQEKINKLAQVRGWAQVRHRTIQLQHAMSRFAAAYMLVIYYRTNCLRVLPHCCHLDFHRSAHGTGVPACPALASLNRRRSSGMRNKSM